VNITLNHPFKVYCHDKRILFAGMIGKDGKFDAKKCTIDKFMKAVCDQADNRAPEIAALRDGSKHVGDGFEIFVEAMIKLMSCDPRIGIYEYEPQTKRDMGVDGAGVGYDNLSATVQAKYRPNSESLLTAGKDRLDSFVTESFIRFNIVKGGNKNMLVVTTAAGLHQITKDEKFGGLVRCIGKDQLDKLTKGNTSFWKKFHDLMI
jgi:hypothetical protein